MSGDLALFRRRLLKNPRQISAIAPSSRILARAMTLGLGPNSGRVVEFGPGTGRFTEAILARGIRPENLTLFELDEEFVAHLRGKFPGVIVHHLPAQDCARLVAPGVTTVISGLPLLSMPPAVRDGIVASAFQVLVPRGRMVQFTYGGGPPAGAAGGAGRAGAGCGPWPEGLGQPAARKRVSLSPRLRRRHTRACRLRSQAPGAIETRPATGGQA